MRGSEAQEQIISRGRRTVETVTCKVCGATQKLYFGARNEDLKAKSLCFQCNFWLGFVESDPSDPNAVIIKGRHYMIGDEDRERPSSMRGFAGHRFIIEKVSGERIVTTNLWLQGVIPERFRDRLIDNAKFIDK